MHQRWIPDVWVRASFSHRPLTWQALFCDSQISQNKNMLRTRTCKIKADHFTLKNHRDARNPLPVMFYTFSIRNMNWTILWVSQWPCHHTDFTNAIYILLISLRITNKIISPAADWFHTRNVHARLPQFRYSSMCHSVILYHLGRQSLPGIDA